MVNVYGTLHTGNNNYILSIMVGCSMYYTCTVNNCIAATLLITALGIYSEKMNPILEPSSSDSSEVSSFSKSSPFGADLTSILSTSSKSCPKPWFDPPMLLLQTRMAFWVALLSGVLVWTISHFSASTSLQTCSGTFLHLCLVTG